MNKGKQIRRNVGTTALPCPKESLHLFFLVHKIQLLLFTSHSKSKRDDLASIECLA